LSTSTPPPLLSRSRYANALLLAHPAFAPDAAAEAGPVTAQFLAAALDGAADDDEAALKTRLRRLRQRVLLRVMARDLSGAATLEEVCGAMSALAETSLRVTQTWAQAKLEAKHGVPRTAGGSAQELIIVGMGKLGGGELNVSSDIDLVFVYPEEGETDGAAPLSVHEFFARLGQRIIAVLGEVTADGFVFRVDMRLRPYGESGPLVASLEALENYFVTQGREWERYAWIKARALTGTEDSALEATVRPFVYRKYLDFATLAAMRRLHAEVRREVARRELVDHVKLGPGGIREIEFIAQALQLVRAGRDVALRVRPTLEVLARLAERGLLPADALPELTAAYRFLRKVEHRLQYLDDRQTHELPRDAADREAVAQMSGFTDWAAFAIALEAQRAAVTRHFRAAFAETPESGDAALWQDDREAVAVLLEARGFRDAQATSARLAAARSSQRYTQLPTDSRRRFNALVPALATVAAASDDPDTTLARGLDLIEAIARRAPYLALLAERPEALERVTRMISASSWAAEYVTQHPLLLDELLDNDVLYAAPNWPAFVDSLRDEISRHAGDVEAQMNALREQHQAASFRLLAQDLAEVLTLERLADHLSTLADLILDEALMLVWSQLRNRHLEGPPRFAIVAYGKLGGKELGYASDLDIIFVYDDPAPEALEVYSRLAQRLNNALTTRTSAGVLFDTDLRLRPSGDAGLLVSSVEALERYQQENAWVWEHQALTRARWCAGDATAGAKFETLRTRILRRPRDVKGLAPEVLAMRRKMHTAHPNKSKLFDLKHDHGGMIDIEFMVQFLVLAHAPAEPRLVANLGNIALLGLAGELGLLDPALAAGCQAAYHDFRRRQHALRLNGARFARVPPASVADAAGAVRAAWAAVFAGHAAAEAPRAPKP